MPLQTETIAIPVVKGMNINTSARLVQPPDLLEALNTSFATGSAAKRYGHVATVARNGSYPSGFARPTLQPPAITPYGSKILDTNWLFGWGYITSNIRGSDSTYLERSSFPEAGYLFGATNRDSEVIGWNGHSLYSQAPGQNNTQGLISTAVMPSCRTFPIAKDSEHQFAPDAVDNGIIRVVAWLDTNSTELGYYSVYDSVTGAPILIKAELTPVDIPSNLRILCLGSFVHILMLTITGTNLRLYTINSANPTVTVERSLGEATFFDVYKVDENTAVVAKVTVAQDITTQWFNAAGAAHPDYDAATVNIGTNNAVDVGVCKHPTYPALSFVFTSDSTSTSNPDEFVGVVCNLDGTQIGTQRTLYTLQASEVGQYHAVTVAPRFLLGTRGLPLFIAFGTFYAGTVGFGGTGGNIIKSIIFDETGVYDTITKYHWRVATQAIRCGDRCFVWAGHPSTLQGTWALLDEKLDPVGHLSFGVANTKDPDGALVDFARNQYIRSMNWRLYENQTLKDVLVFMGAFTYKVRVAVEDEETVGLFTEPSILFTEIDFLPALRSAQAGRCTYFAGAQVWMYDGARLDEQGFLVCPNVTLSASTTGGPGLTLLGTYSYRVDVCHRNNQNEEVRSHSLLVQKELTGLNNTITLIIPTCLTRRTDAYFLVFRNSMQSGSPTTSWNLINSRDPTSAAFLRNDQSTHSLNYVDDGTVSDTAGLSRELHPNNVTNYLMPFAGPACEIISAGRDRLWVAGGELNAGQIAASRLFEPGDVPAFNANTFQQVDRSSEAITGIGFVGDIAVVFRRNQTYLIEGDGPDNIASGYWTPARLVYSDVGAISPDSIGLISAGLCFLSPAGFRMVSAGGGLTNIGDPVDSEAVTFSCSSTLVVGEDREIRFYGPDGAFVYNYENQAWSFWDIKSLGVAKQLNGRAVCVYGSNFLTETSGYYLDNVSPFTHRIQFPWLRSGNLGDFQRIRRIAGFGTFDPSRPHDIRVAIYYDERDFPEEWWDCTIPDSSQNEDAWGNSTWGAGVWGDTSSVGKGLEDSVWRWRRRPRRQKCSVFSVSVSDRGTNGPGFNMTVLGLEIAKKQGLDRIPAVTGGSSVNRG